MIRFNSWKPMNWEDMIVDDNKTVMDRLKIHGGWLVRTSSSKYLWPTQGAEAVTFVPDPNHQWILQNKE